MKDPFGVVRDPLDSLYVAGTQTGGLGPEHGVILKRRPDGQIVTFAQMLREPRGMALDTKGNLYLVEAEQKRVLKFLAPQPPILDPAPPDFTNQATLVLHGTTEPGALLTVQGGSAPVTGFADPTGAFAMSAPLARNQPNTLQLFATAASGDGLTSAPTSVTIIHDDLPPLVRIVNPAEGATVTEAFVVDAEATDVLAGVGRVDLLVDGTVVGVTNVAPYRFSLEAKAFTGGSHTVTARAMDRAGNQASASVSVVIFALRVTITTPSEGTRVLAGLLLVRGTVEAAGAEVGVMINTIPGAVQGTSFAALVPVTSDTTTLTAVATIATGMTASHSVAITVSSAQTSPIALLTNPQSGVAPLTVEFSFLGATPGATIKLDFDGDGTIDFTGPSPDGQAFTLPKPGLYVPTVTLTDAQGNQVTTSTLVQVYDQAALDALLQAKWAALKDALRRGDVAQALTHIVLRSRPKYEQAFKLIAPRLPDIDSILPTATLVKVRDRSAIYEATRTDEGLLKSFEIRFAFDGDGIWRIEAF